MGISICFLVSEHPFLDARIFKKEAKSLLKQGYHVTMIVPRKKGYLFDVDGIIFRDSFLSQTFMHERIKIITYEQINHEKQLKSLHQNLYSENQFRFTDPLTQLGIEQKADIYHAHEFFSLYSAVGIKRVLTAKGRRCKVIYDSHELEPDPLIKQSQQTLKVKKEMLDNMFNDTDYVITVSESIKDWYRLRNPHLPIEVVYNSPPLAPKYEPERSNKSGLLLAYEGTVNNKRGSFQKLMKVVEMCEEQFDLKVKIIGGSKSKENLFNRIPSHLTEKIQFTGWVDYDSIPNFMKDVDLGWVDLDVANSLNNRFAMPNKFFSYLNNGVPVLANQGKDMEKFIENYQCGYIVKKRNATAEDYVQALHMLHSNRNKIHRMSLKARQVMETQYSWEHMENRLFAVYEHLIKDL